MENEKKNLIDKGLCLRSEEINEVMGIVPYRIFRVGTFMIICIVVLLSLIGYTLQFPSYIDVSFIVFGKKTPIGIVSKDAGTVMFRYNHPHEIEPGDTIATIVKDGKETHYISPISGIVENNFLYETGDNIVNGDTLVRIISHKLPNYKLILKIPLNMKSEITSGMRIKFSTEGVMSDKAVGYIKKVSMIPDEANCYNAIVELSINDLQNLPTSGKGKLYYKTENIFEKILTTKHTRSSHKP